MYDIIVVGAGPAGSFAAYSCAKAGLRTLLLEKEKLPRDKPCGGLVGKGALDLAGFDLERIAENRITANKILMDGSEILSKDSEMLLFKRKKLDYFLAKKAVSEGAELVERAKVSSVRIGAGGASVLCGPESYEGKIIVGADGVGSAVAKSAGLNTRTAKDLCLSIESGINAKNICMAQEKNYAEFCLYSDFVGYFWIFPSKDYVNVGVGAPLEGGSNLQQKLSWFLKKRGISKKGAVKAHMIPLSVLPKIYSRRLVLVGDAAGFVNPISGGGIGLALASAKKAADACVNAVRKNDFSPEFLGAYQSSCRKEIEFIKKQRRYADFFSWLIRNRLVSARSAKLLLGILGKYVV